MPKLRTYCTGGDLFGVGAVAAGYAVVDGFELEDRIAAVARLNGHNVYTADVTRVDFDSLSYCDHEHASPSCKTASQANTKGGETKTDLAVADAMCRAIKAHAARGGKTWSLENVWGYRNYESFQRILAALTANGFIYEFSHINMADYGVPQTRKRLILRAVHRSIADRVPGLHPTHRDGGDMFHQPWVGWLEAVADIIHTFPTTKPAAWQVQRLARMPEYSVLIHPTDMRTMPTRRADQPATIVKAGSGKRASGDYPRAFVIDGQANSNGQTMTVRDCDDPIFTLTSTMDKRPTRAYLCGDRAHQAGRWIKIPIQGLMRFQTVPDSYKGLTAEINGNGVPCLFAQRMMESLQCL